MKILGRTQMLVTESLEEAISEIGKLGFDGAEICLERRDWSLYPFGLDAAKSARDAADAAGFSWRSLSFHQDYIYSDERYTATMETIPLTREIGSDVFVFSGCKKKTGDSAEWRRTVERTKEMAKVAEDCGVKLALEFEPNFVVGSTKELLRLMDEVNSPNLCANMDLGHVFLVDEDPLGSIDAVADRIVHCHIENMASGVHKHLLPWEGEMDLQNYVDRLKGVGFSGGLALDMYDCDYAAVAGECISYLRKLID